MEELSLTFHQLRDKVCRLCLEERPQLADLEGLSFDAFAFGDLISDCYAIDIKLKQRNIPLVVCRKCIVATLNFHAFKTKVIENEVFLQNMAARECALSLPCASSASSGVGSEDEGAKEPKEGSCETNEVVQAKIYECSACEKSFCTPSEWKAHMISHYSFSKYACMHCAETFASKHELIVHNYTHLYKGSAKKLP